MNLAVPNICSIFASQSQAILTLDHLTSRLIFGQAEADNRLREKGHENLRQEIKEPTSGPRTHRGLRISRLRAREREQSLFSIMKPAVAESQFCMNPTLVISPPREAI